MTGLSKRNIGLIHQMTKRSIQERYKGSALGFLWSFLTPIFMLVVYTFIFTTVLPSRWPNTDSMNTFQFAVILFAGLSLYGFMSEVFMQSAGLIIANVNYVKKVVFPVVILPVILTSSALFNLLISLLILLGFQLITTGSLSWTLVFMPLILLPFVLCILGISWLLASLGTYMRDLNQIITPLVTALLFLGPILYPASTLPEATRAYLYLNPLSFPVEQIRDVVIWGKLPNWHGLLIYSSVSIAVCVLGYLWFNKTKQGFADVL